MSSILLQILGTDIFCGASLVTDRHLVTAAHCLYGVDSSLFSQLDILLAEYNILDSNKGIRRKIKEVVFHPSYNEDTLENDIAIISMRMPVNISPGGPILRFCLFIASV